MDHGRLQRVQLAQRITNMELQPRPMPYYNPELFAPYIYSAFWVDVVGSRVTGGGDLLVQGQSNRAKMLSQVSHK